MGLDICMMGWELEEMFAQPLHEVAPGSLNTPRKVIDCFAHLLPKAPLDYCLSQRAFHRLRQALCDVLVIPRYALRPTTCLLTLVEDTRRESLWPSVGERLKAKRWPKLGGPSWWSLSPRVHSVEDIVDFLLACSPRSVKDPHEGWTQRQIAGVVRRVVLRYSGLGEVEYDEHLRFTEDMGIC